MKRKRKRMAKVSTLILIMEMNRSAFMRLLCIIHRPHRNQYVDVVFFVYSNQLSFALSYRVHGINYTLYIKPAQPTNKPTISWNCNVLN